MRLFLAVIIFTSGLIQFFSSTALSDTNPPPAISQSMPVAKVTSAQPQVSSSDTTATLINSQPQMNAKDKELVVVSKTPEFFSYTLSSIAVLLTVITILVAIVTGVGLTVVIKASSEKKKLEAIRASFDQEQKEVRENLKREYTKMIDTLQHTAFGSVNFQRAKHDLRELLSMPDPSPKDAFLLIQKTVRYSDAECLTLYSKALTIFETNIDIVRVVRNGILQFSRNINNMFAIL